MLVHFLLFWSPVVCSAIILWSCNFYLCDFWMFDSVLQVKLIKGEVDNNFLYKDIFGGVHSV